MHPTHETSYGIIPLRKRNGMYEVFLIHQKSRLGDTFWTFPKGHADEEEGGQAAALRELNEETGLQACIDQTYVPYEQLYSFPENGIIVEKKVLYFVGWVESVEGLSLQEKEVIEGGWFGLKDAEGRVTHQRLSEVLSNLQERLAQEVAK